MAMAKLAIYGASGHGKVIADIAKKCGYTEYVFIDDGDNTYDSFEIFQKKYPYVKDIVLAIGDNGIRFRIYEKLHTLGYNIITLIDPSAMIVSSVQIQRGTVVMPGVIINADVSIGKGAIINSGAVIEHDIMIGDFTHISPQVSLAGGVCIGSFSHIGIGSCVIQNITIGDHVVVGAGSVVIRDIEHKHIVVGNPAKQIR